MPLLREYVVGTVDNIAVIDVLHCPLLVRQVMAVLLCHGVQCCCVAVVVNSLCCFCGCYEFLKELIYESQFSLSPLLDLTSHRVKWVSSVSSYSAQYDTR